MKLIQLNQHLTDFASNLDIVNVKVSASNHLYAALLEAGIEVLKITSKCPSDFPFRCLPSSEVEAKVRKTLLVHKGIRGGVITLDLVSLSGGVILCRIDSPMFSRELKAAGIPPVWLVAGTGLIYQSGY